jgi:hypothetical protein
MNDTPEEINAVCPADVDNASKNLSLTNVLNRIETGIADSINRFLDNESDRTKNESGYPDDFLIIEKVKNGMLLASKKTQKYSDIADSIFEMKETMLLSESVWNELEFVSDMLRLIGD